MIVTENGRAVVVTAINSRFAVKAAETGNLHISTRNAISRTLAVASIEEAEEFLAILGEAIVNARSIKARLLESEGA